MAAKAGVSPNTLRYYESTGVIPPAERSPNGYRDYDDSVIERLAFVRTAQAIGLTLAEIREVLGVRDEGAPPCWHVVDLLERHAGALAERIAELEGLQRELDGLLARGRRLDPVDCSPSAVCEVINPEWPAPGEAPAEPAARRAG